MSETQEKQTNLNPLTKRIGYLFFILRKRFLVGRFISESS